VLHAAPRGHMHKTLFFCSPGREADDSSPSNVKVKNAWSCTSNPQYAFMAWCSVKSTEATLPLPLPLFEDEFEHSRSQNKTDR
jgi:hypothetical protein